MSKNQNKESQLTERLGWIVRHPDANHPSGVWTPHAQVLCYECHGPTWYRSETAIPNYGERCTPRLVGEYEELALCDSCAKPVWISEDIAIEQACIRAIDELDIPGVTTGMQQTGGMCSAACASFGERFVCITNSEEADKHIGGTLLVTLNTSEDKFWDGDQPLADQQCWTPREVASLVQQWAIESDQLPSPAFVEGQGIDDDWRDPTTEGE